MSKRLGRPFWISISPDETIEDAIAFLEDAIRTLRKELNDREGERGLREHSNDSKQTE